MRKIGKPHQSLIEAIASGQVEELLCLQSEVGPADGLFSHVQVVAVADTVATLEDSEKQYEEVLLVDKEAVEALRRKALEDNLRSGKDNLPRVYKSLASYPSPVAQEEFLRQRYLYDGPALASITAIKQHMRPRFFVDYFNIRQCIKNDFATDRLVDAIATWAPTFAPIVRC
jgi:hypothetical protein